MDSHSDSLTRSYQDPSTKAENLLIGVCTHDQAIFFICVQLVSALHLNPSAPSDIMIQVHTS